MEVGTLSADKSSKGNVRVRRFVFLTVDTKRVEFISVNKVQYEIHLIGWLSAYWQTVLTECVVVDTFHIIFN